MPKHREGGKITNAHSTLITAAEIVVDTAVKCPDVSKIHLGRITTGIPGGDYRLKFSPITGGVCINIRAPSSTQELYIYTRSLEQTQQAIEEAFRRKHGVRKHSNRT